MPAADEPSKYEEDRGFEVEVDLPRAEDSRSNRLLLLPTSYRSRDPTYPAEPPPPPPDPAVANLDELSKLLLPP